MRKIIGVMGRILIVLPLITLFGMLAFGFYYDCGIDYWKGLMIMCGAVALIIIGCGDFL